jgi:hypothetical protein
MTQTNTPQIKIVNIETGKEVIRDMNVEELAQLEADRENAAAYKAATVQKAADRAALLAQLGINEEQAKLLLG